MYARLGVSDHTVAAFFWGHGVDRASGVDGYEIEISFDLHFAAPSSRYAFAPGVVLGVLTLGFRSEVSGRD